MRVAIIFHCFAHYRAAVLREIRRCGDRAGIEFFFVGGLSAKEPALKVLAPDGNEEDVFHARWIEVQNVWLGAHFLIQPRVIQIAYIGQFDAIVFLGNMYYLSTWIAALICRFKSKPVLFWTHGIRRDESGLRWFLRGSFYKIADRLLLFGDRAKELLRSKGFDSGNLRVIYNSLDYDAQVSIRDSISSSSIASLRSELLLGSTDRVIVCVGRFTRDKQIGLLIDAVFRLSQMGRSVVAILVGTGPTIDEVRSRVDELQLGQMIRFVGARFDEQFIGRLISLADVACIPGNIGLFGIHAMAYGTPVVTHSDFNTQKPEAEIIQDGICGGLFRRDSVEDLVEKLDYWISDRQRLRRAEVSRLCIDRVESHYTPCAQAQKIVDAVREVIRCT